MDFRESENYVSKEKVKVHFDTDDVNRVTYVWNNGYRIRIHPYGFILYKDKQIIEEGVVKE